MNEFNKFVGYKINIQKFVAFLYTNNEVVQRKTKKTIPFTTAPKIIKYLGINLTKKVKDLYSDNHKILTKEIEDSTNKFIFYVHGLEEPVLLKRAYYPKQSTDFMQSLSKYR